LERNPSTTFMFIGNRMPFVIDGHTRYKGVLLGEPHPRLPP
jgi:hypothetical protein